MSEQSKTVSTDSLLQEKRTFPPSPATVKRAYINAKKYQAMYERSVKDPDGFWLEQAKTLDWVKKPTAGRKYVWNTAAKKIQHTFFEDGQLNVSVNCLDRHLKTATRTKPAIIWQGEPENDVRIFTYEQLHAEVCKFANVLKSFGVEARRPRFHLPAHDSRTARRDARLRAASAPSIPWSSADSARTRWRAASTTRPASC